MLSLLVMAIGSFAIIDDEMAGATLSRGRY
jgi:hypothetical protein